MPERPGRIKEGAVRRGRADGGFQLLNGGLQLLLQPRQIARFLLLSRQLLSRIALGDRQLFTLEQGIDIARDVMHRHAAAGKGPVSQRCGRGTGALQRTGAHVDLCRIRTARAQQAELAIVLAFPAAFIDHRAVAMTGQLAIGAGPLRPGLLAGGFNLFAIAGVGGRTP